MVEFVVKSIKSQWKPPFKKDIQEKEHTVYDGQSFEEFNEKNKKNETVFKLIKTEEEKALIEYHDEFTLKGASNPKNKQIWLQKGKPISITFLWGEDGITKTITLK